MTTFDTHVHAISRDMDSYPLKPLGGNQSDWSKTRPVDVDGLIEHLDLAGVDQAVLVQASTAYGYDNRYAADALAAHPDRLVGVCSVDFLSDTAVADLRYWIEDRGFSGVRIRVSDGLTKVSTPGLGLSDERMQPVWDYVGRARIPVCVQMHSKDTAKLVEVLRAHPDTTVLLDHAGRPDASGGPPYDKLAELGQLAEFPGVHLKVTPSALRRLHAEPGADVTDVLKRLVQDFGSDHVMWGSDFPAFDGPLSDARAAIEREFAWLDQGARAEVLGANAARVYGVTVTTS